MCVVHPNGFDEVPIRTIPEEPLTESRIEVPKPVGRSLPLVTEMVEDEWSDESEESFGTSVNPESDMSLESVSAAGLVLGMRSRR